MTFILELQDDYMRPAIKCDRCGASVTASGFNLWNVDAHPKGGEPESVQLCSEECLEAFYDRRPLDEEWVAVSIDAYLTNLIDSLSIDTGQVKERERGMWAAEHTRHEAPD
ncbi:MAG: hypothetical protein WBW04_10250 [Nitrolancea sp.]